MIFFGTEQDCRNLREAFDFASGMPFPPDPYTHETMTTPQQALYTAWLAADIAGKAILEASGAYDGWTLHMNPVYPVDSPGFGWFTNIPDDLLTVVVPVCLNTYNRTLSIQRLNVLMAAAAVMQEELPPLWVPEEE